VSATWVLLAVYALFAAVVALARDTGMAGWLPSVVLLSLAALRQRAGTRAGVAWALLPVFCIPLLYAQVGPLVARSAMHDAPVLAFERRLFGDPSHAWAMRWPSNALSTVLHASYLSYYAIIFLPPILLAWRRERAALERTSLALTIAFIVACVGFVLWPVEGPRYDPHPATAPAANAARDAVLAILHRFSSRGAAFPSSHVSIAVVQTIIAWRTQPRVAVVLTVLTFGLAFGAVYGGFHYLVDVVAGAGVGVAVASLVLLRTRQSTCWLPRGMRRSAPALFLAAISLTACATAPSHQHRFYRSLPYGTERQFNPISEIVNEGFDLLRSDDADRRVFGLPYGAEWKNLVSTVRDPRRDFGQYGYGYWARHELFPLTYKNHAGGQWVPNYQFHLIGSGMVSARMTEWYEQRGVSHPAVWSATTMMVAHVLNEMTERPNPHSQDAATDLLIFDPLGILLFRLDRVQRLASGPLQLTNWPMQPSLTFPGKTIENVGQEFIVRFRIPKTTNWSALYMFGVSTQLGVSRDVGGGNKISIGAGADAVENPVADSTKDARTVILKPKAGIYCDRNGSLLMSIVARRGYESLATFNMYPGAVFGSRMPFGVWLSPVRGGKLRWGIASSWGLGIAGGPTTRH
jgi:membrane-associated phospholipid phosphatase